MNANAPPADKTTQQATVRKRNACRKEKNCLAGCFRSDCENSALDLLSLDFVIISASCGWNGMGEGVCFDTMGLCCLKRGLKYRVCEGVQVWYGVRKVYINSAMGDSTAYDSSMLAKIRAGFRTN